MQPEIQPMNPRVPNIEPPKNRAPNKASPDIERTLNSNYDSSDKDFSKFSDFSPGQVNKLHTRSDVDSGPLAQHHTLGYQRNQASPGDHIHDGKTSKKLAQGMGLVLTGSKGGNAALANLITMLANVMEFTDNTT